MTFVDTAATGLAAVDGTTVLTVLAGAAITVGTFFIAVAGVGLLRLADVYARMNAITKAATLGLILILLGSFLLMPSWTSAWKVALAIALQLLTSPVGAYAIGRAAYRSGAPLWERTNFDDLDGRTQDRS